MEPKCFAEIREFIEAELIHRNMTEDEIGRLGVFTNAIWHEGANTSARKLAGAINVLLKQEFA